MKNLTALSKFLRKLRIDKSMNQAEVANALECSTAFYSSVENSKKPMPENMRTKLIEFYQLNKGQIYELDEAIKLNKQEVHINLADLDDTRKDFVLAFARNFKNLDQEEVQRLQTMFSKQN